MSKNLYGTDPDQVPTNADLGTMAYQSENISVTIIKGAEVINGKSYPQTSSDATYSIIDTGLRIGDFGGGAIFEVFFKGNANPGGFSSYRSTGHYDVLYNRDFSGGVIDKISVTKLSFGTGGSGSTELTLTAVLWDGSSEHTSVSYDNDLTIRLKISGWLSTKGSGLELYMVRRI